ncbi:hypothetical protein CLV63_112110 [Murinocardiopsis flavida]|uniref:Uncharacterized protein n=1 Tax=Murinocardiopsis flavida TaxID=645275 RepID=A0A2P8DG96_9ACTN|nr:hypothetical protein [Murinocardiopsis flavida]PSK96228.1 hypothetical protein CLV63_112110 [Murinocardiopsis flavida]
MGMVGAETGGPHPWAEVVCDACGERLRVVLPGGLAPAALGEAARAAAEQQNDWTRADTSVFCPWHCQDAARRILARLEPPRRDRGRIFTAFDPGPLPLSRGPRHASDHVCAVRTQIGHLYETVERWSHRERLTGPQLRRLVRHTRDLLCHLERLRKTIAGAHIAVPVAHPGPATPLDCTIGRSGVIRHDPSVLYAPGDIIDLDASTNLDGRTRGADPATTPGRTVQVLATHLRHRPGRAGLTAAYTVQLADAALGPAGLDQITHDALHSPRPSKLEGVLPFSGHLARLGDWTELLTWHGYHLMRQLAHGEFAVGRVVAIANAPGPNYPRSPELPADLTTATSGQLWAWLPRPAPGPPPLPRRLGLGRGRDLLAPGDLVTASTAEGPETGVVSWVHLHAGGGDIVPTYTLALAPRAGRPAARAITLPPPDLCPAPEAVWPQDPAPAEQLHTELDDMLSTGADPLAALAGALEQLPDAPAGTARAVLAEHPDLGRAAGRHRIDTAVLLLAQVPSSDLDTRLREAVARLARDHGMHRLLTASDLPSTALPALLEPP